MKFALNPAVALLDPLVGMRDRWFLWLPVGIGAGIALYFALPVEPSPLASALPALVFGAAYVGLRRHKGLAVVLLALLALSLGFGAAKWRAERVGTSVLAQRLAPLELEARVHEMEARPGERPRAVLGDILGGDGHAPLPRRIRVTFDPDMLAAPFPPGARIRFTGILLPPPGPVMPGAPDYGRNLWFDGIGAVGYATAAPQLLAGSAGGLDAWRQRAADGLVLAMPAPEGGIAAALMLGLRGAVPEAVEARWRAAGISHILSISGLHIGLAAGVILFSLRLLLAAVPFLSLRFPVKKWAAAAAILSAGAYMVVAGMDVPAQRSFIMTGIVLFAVLVDRLAITLRLVAIAAAIVLLIEPESLTAPGFGMSFASVTALVAAYEAARTRVASWRAGGGWLRRGLLALGGILASSVIATLATAPFAIAHFGRLSVYGLAANLLAIPVTGFVIMPAAVATAVLAPLGLEAPALAVLGFGIRLVDDLAIAIEPLPGAAMAVPAMGQGALLLFVLGGLCLCLWRGGFRLSGLPLIAAGFALWLAGTMQTPLLLIHGEGRAVAAPVGGRLLALPPASPRFVVEQWAERLGLPAPDILPARDVCRRGICTLKLGTGGEVTVASSRATEAPACTAVVIQLKDEALDCPANSLVLTGNDLAGSGVLTVAVDGETRSVEAGRGLRPWTPAYWARSAPTAQ
ncbi:ComEC/Rec2 family competence protein [Zavarzinia aquatilis]|uniref:Competence protein ComEC n=1 Tax=Zavarzinia aquatilis TaxID=2211142 RepID=A0A317EHS3_9PROT|nr:ComEC/Rec2 family competence protein [Zavarzinia aquatilis]PWR25836.1 hypothetical protein DKG74_02475 [Zavarzinia aquatilis]